jgi:uncharacterized protein (TIGR01777 family)
MNKIVLAGGSGFLGGELAAYFLNKNWEVVILTRHPGQVEKSTTGGEDVGGFTTGRQRRNPGPIRDSSRRLLQSEGWDARGVTWDARTLGPWASELDGATAVVNLTGKSVDCRYNARNRKEILRSRVESTRVIGEAINHCERPPRVWLNASTATVYKHTIGQPWDETGETGSTPEANDAFSIEVADAWEQALNVALTPVTRKIALRTTLVLGLGRNSVFPVLRRLTRLGLGGKMGTGTQFVSWIHVRDFCRSIEFLIDHHEIEGVVNIAAPNPVPNREMMKSLRGVCSAPIGLPASKWMLEIGAFFLRTETELILKSRRVIPGRLLDAGFRFDFPILKNAFEHLAIRRL